MSTKKQNTITETDSKIMLVKIPIRGLTAEELSEKLEQADEELFENNEVYSLEKTIKTACDGLAKGYKYAGLFFEFNDFSSAEKKAGIVKEVFRQHFPRVKVEIIDAYEKYYFAFADIISPKLVFYTIEDKNCTDDFFKAGKLMFDRLKKSGTDTDVVIVKSLFIDADKIEDEPAFNTDYSTTERFNKPVIVLEDKIIFEGQFTEEIL